MTDTSLCSYFGPESGPPWPPCFACGLTSLTQLKVSIASVTCSVRHLHQVPIIPEPPSPLAQGPPNLRRIRSNAARASRYLISTSNDPVGSVADSSLKARLNHHVTRWKGERPIQSYFAGVACECRSKVLNP